MLIMRLEYYLKKIYNVIVEIAKEILLKFKLFIQYSNERECQFKLKARPIMQRES